MLRDPVGGRAERFRVEPAVVDAPLAAPFQEPGLLEDLQVLRDCGQRDVERLRQVGDARFPEREAREDGAASRVGECRERSVE